MLDERSMVLSLLASVMLMSMVSRVGETGFTGCSVPTPRGDQRFLIERYRIPQIRCDLRSDRLALGEITHKWQSLILMASPGEIDLRAIYQGVLMNRVAIASVNYRSPGAEASRRRFPASLNTASEAAGRSQRLTSSSQALVFRPDFSIDLSGFAFDPPPRPSAL